MASESGIEDHCKALFWNFIAYRIVANVSKLHQLYKNYNVEVAAYFDYSKTVIRLTTGPLATCARDSMVASSHIRE